MLRPIVGHRRSNRPYRPLGLAWAALVLTLLLPTAAPAATPADVLHAVDQVMAKARLLHDTNFSDATVEKVDRPQTLHPRHVLQMVRAVQKKANTLAWLNGVETISIGPMPTKKVEPMDVLANVDALARVIDGMLPVFGINAEVEPTPRREDVTFNDAYSTLLELSQLIDGLGTPGTVTNNIYMIVDSINLELEIISNHYLKTYELEEHDMAFYRTRSGGQRRENKASSLEDIYASSFVLAKALERLILLQPELAPTGGILHPSPLPNTIDADHVSHALNDVLADVVAMKATTGDLIRSPSKPLASGMTPTHVSNRLQDAIGLVDALAMMVER